MNWFWPPDDRSFKQSWDRAFLVVVLPYHEQRKPAGAKAAEYFVSANLGRTIEAARQSVSDIRSCADWLESQGCTRLGLVGTSLGAGFMDSWPARTTPDLA